VPPSPLASIFSDSLGASPVTQPGQTDGFGHYFFYAPAGLYTVIIVIGGQVYQVLPDQNLGNGGLNVSVTGTPVAGQALVATGPTTASWQAIFGSTINYPAITNQFLNSYNSVTGLFTSAQPVLSGIGNPTSNVNFIFNANTFTRTYSQSSALGNEVLANSNAATVFGNVTSPTLSFAGAVWNGSTSVTDSWNLSLVTGGGPNPTSNFTFQHIGSSGVGSVLVPNLITTNLSIGRIIYDNNGQSGNTGQVLTSTTLGAIWQNSPAVTTLNGSGATFVTGTPGNYTITTLVSGSSTTAVSANANVSTAPTGDIFVSDGNGNLQDSGVSIDSVFVAAVVLSPSANQTIASFSLLPAPGNKTQSLGSASAPWNAYLNILNGGTTIYLTGATDPYSGLIQNAINALPGAGGVVDASALGVAAVAQGSIDPLTKAVKIVLGPYAYTVTNIMLRTGMVICGTSSKTSSLTLTSSATAMFSVPQALTNGIADNVWLHDLSLFGYNSGSNTQICMDFDTSGAATGASTEYSVFERLNIQQFGGNTIVLKGNPNNFSNCFQFLTFRDIDIFTPNNTADAFLISGGGGQTYFFNLYVEGPSPYTGTGIGVNVVSGGGTAYSYNLNFYGCTFQGFNIAVAAAQTFDLTIDGGHFEQVQGILQIGAAAHGTVLRNSFMAGTTGIGTASPGLGVGAGYMVNVAAAGVLGVHIHDNTFNTAMDSVLVNPNFVLVDALTNISVNASGNTFQTSGNGYNNPAGLGASIASTTLLTTPATGLGLLYRVSYYLVIGTAATSSGSVALSILWNDGHATQTVSPTTPANTAGAYIQGEIIIQTAGSTSVTFNTVYASSGATSLKYGLVLRVVPLQ
jgi:hypothetical protein